MALVIAQRPKGLIFGTPVTAPIDDNGGGGQFRISSTAHGLVTGDVVYISSDVSAYNGYWVVQLDGANTFFITPYVGGDRVLYISGTSVDYYASNPHGWSCAHLPVVYKITNTKWPTNSEDTAQTISTLNDDLGYARVTLSGSLGTFEDLSFVKISNAANSDFNGVYQILDKLSTTNITLNVAYSTFNGAGLLGATIQLYYGNYNTVVRVYAGINSSHQWTAQKPYELAATLELIPDDDNVVIFSINEILKAYIETKNDLLLGTLPNNIEAWVNFYIEYAEQYDSSNGYTVSTTLSSFTSDLSTFEGTAVNAILPFKNIQSGYLSEYLMTNSAAKFLTLFTIPVLFSCGDDTPECYSDISFLNPYYGVSLNLNQKYYSNGVLILTVNDYIDADPGVIRAELTPNCNADRVDILIRQQLAIVGLATWAQVVSGTRTWTIDADPSVDLLSATSSYYLYTPLVGVPGKTYTITYSFTNSTGADTDVTIEIGFLNSSFAAIAGASDGTDFTAGGTITGSFTITMPSTNTLATTGAYLYIKAAQTDVGATTVTVNSITLVETEVVLSETKQFDIDCGCADQEVRLTWLNYLGGFDYWVFNTETGKAIDILSATETTKNIFPEWPNSYGEFSDTIRKQVSRESTNRLFFTTQYLTEDQADAVAYIKTSPLVQIVNSKADRRTIIVDTDSFTKYTDNQKLITISFSARYTDNIGSQKV